MTTTVQPRVRGTTIKRLLGVAGASTAALILWAIVDPFGGTDLLVRTGGETVRVGPAAVLVASLAAGLAGWGLLAVLERFTARPRRTWLLTAGAVLALSLLGPLGSAAGGSTMVILAGMHILVGGTLIVVFGARP